MSCDWQDVLDKFQKYGDDFLPRAVKGEAGMIDGRDNRAVSKNRRLEWAF